VVQRSLRLTLADRREVAPGYHVLAFAQAAGEAPLLAEAGQFAMVRGATWGSAPLLPRPMSLLTDSRAEQGPSILIKVVGEGSTRMAAASVGEPYDLLAPLGVPFVIAPELGRGKRAVLVAGGVGVVPLVWLAKELAAQGSAPIVLYGGRTPNDLPLDDALAAVGDLRVTTEDGGRGTKGRVTALLAPLVDERGDELVVYTCGPNPMMAAVAKICARRGVACQASLEAPMACGYGVCLGCNVPLSEGGFLYLCTAGPCVDARIIDWSKVGRMHA
jgi:dihydroorotate dehydrogenase electron transfer subunit